MQKSLKQKKKKTNKTQNKKKISINFMRIFAYFVGGAFSRSLLNFLVSGEVVLLVDLGSSLVSFGKALLLPLAHPGNPSVSSVALRSSFANIAMSS